MLVPLALQEGNGVGERTPLTTVSDRTPCPRPVCTCPRSTMSVCGTLFRPLCPLP